MLRLAGRHPLLSDGPVMLDDGAPSLTVDMSQLQFASPLDLCALAAIVDAQAEQSEVTLAMPTDPDVARYLSRMNLISNLPDNVVVVGDTPVGDRRPLDTMLVELTRVAEPADAERVGERFRRVALAQFGGAASQLFRAMGELLDNAVSHGSHPGVAFASAQYYSGTTSGRHGLEVAICDNGIGVLRHLRRNERYARISTSKAALSAALREGVSGVVEEPERGFGLFDVVRIVGSLDLASLVLASGDASLFKRRRNERFVTDEKALITPIDGTWAWLRVRLPKGEQGVLQ